MKASSWMLLGCLPLLAGTALSNEEDTDWCLATLCLWQPEADLIERLGAGSSFPQFGRCYRAGELFLTAGIDDEQDPPTVTSILVTSEPVCPDHPPIAVELMRPQTCRGAAVGNSVGELLERHGSAGKRHPAGSYLYPWTSAPDDVEQLDFECSTAYCSPPLSVFVRDETVVGIAVWVPDC